MSTYSPGEGQSCGMFTPGERNHRTAKRSGSGYGSGRSSRAFTTLKIAVFAPIPMASETTITAVRAGVFTRVRTAYRISVCTGAIGPPDRTEDYYGKLNGP